MEQSFTVYSFENKDEFSFSTLVELKLTIFHKYFHIIIKVDKFPIFLNIKHFVNFSLPSAIINSGCDLQLLSFIPQLFLLLI